MSSSPEPRRATDTAFERLYRRHRREVYGTVLRDLRDPDEAEDVTQTAFLNAYTAIRRGERPDRPRAWLVTIARNVIRRRYRMLARRPVEVELDPEVAAAVMDVEGPTAGEIMAAVRRLPPNQRAVILLREIQGRAYAEIADELGLSLSAVETLIFRARRSLGEELDLVERPPAPRRRLRSVFVLPLPGLGKLGSLGVSVSRVGVAAFLGGVAIVTPMRDREAESKSPSPVLRAPPVTELESPVAPGSVVVPTSGDAGPGAADPAHPKAAKAKTTAGGTPSDGSGGALPGLDVPALSPPAEALPPAVPTSEPLPLPPLPTTEPEPLPPVPTTEPLPLPPLPTSEPLPLPPLPTTEPLPLPPLPTTEPLPLPTTEPPVLPPLPLP